MTRTKVDINSLYDARAIKRLVDNGEPLSTSAAAYGYTPREAEELLAQQAANWLEGQDYAKHTTHKDHQASTDSQRPDSARGVD